GCALAVVLLIGGWGQYRLDHPPEEGEPLTLALIQGDVDQAVKWDTAFLKMTIRRYSGLTDAAREAVAKAGGGLDLAVWPETALPFYFQDENPGSAAVRDYLRAAGLPLLTGAPAYETEPGTRNFSLRNRAFLVDEGAGLRSWYDKMHLVPFGEYMPLPDWLGVDKLAQGVGDYTPGTNEHALRLGPAEFGVLICYEAIFPDLAQRHVEEGANMLVNISNDSWFGDSSAPPQHLAHAALRAVEQGRWLARCTNNGITAFIDPLGRVVGRLPQFEAGFLTHEVKPVEVTTVYHDIYHWELRLLYLAAGLAAAWAVFGPRRSGDTGRWRL
ncbi:MAG: apolipoprotein N-acyltransferase, partial [Desulfovibrionaceae bacterium]